MHPSEALIRRYVDELNKRNFTVLDEVVASTVVFGTDETVTRDAYRQQILDRIKRRPDYSVTIDGLSIEGNEVVIRWTHRATDPATGTPESGEAVSAYRIVNGQIVSVRSLTQP